MSKQIKNKSSNHNGVPSDWEILPLSSLGNFSKGKGILKEQVIESGLPCIRYGEIYTTHDFILKEFKSFISEDVATESKEIKNGDILFAGSGETIEEIGKAVEMKGKFIGVTTKDKSRTKQLVNDWYLQNARTKFPAIAKPLIDKFKKHKAEPTSIILREMPTLWGSCTARGKIILNPELMKAPKGCIEIVHELCHLICIYYDHTQKFIELQTKEMPDWEKWKSKLENLLA